MSFELTDERKAWVYEDLARGSDPRAAFFFLVGASTVIASLGLVMNSTAVVIGAMLVAPLMTPILGLALALVRGDPRFIAIALRAEVFGVAVSIGVSVLLGLALPSYFNATPEMLARTAPNLFDLLVAVFAGMAGAYALVDENISPVLPGVAISTAIVPPLANCGLSLALGAYTGAWGSFLLFFTNFLSILLVAAAVFGIVGLGERLDARAGAARARRLAVAATGFLVVTALLSVELMRMFQAERLHKELSQALQQQLTDQRVSEIEQLVVERKQSTILALARVNAPAIIEPRIVARVEDRLEDRVGEPIELFVRTTVTHDVSASGSMHQAVAESLDGWSVPRDAVDPRVTLLQKAEQVLREHLDEKVGLHLETVEVYPTGTTMVLVAEIAGPRELRGREIEALERQLGEAIPGVPVQLFVRQESTTLRDRLGFVRVEFTHPTTSTELMEVEERFREFVGEWLSERQFRMHACSMTRLDGVNHYLLEVTGPRLFSKEDYAALKASIDAALDFPVTLYVRSEPESVLGVDGEQSLPRLLEEYQRRNQEAFQEERRRLIEEAR